MGNVVVILKVLAYRVGFCEFALRWIPQNTFVDKSTLVQVITRANLDQNSCRQMASLGYSESN